MIVFPNAKINIGLRVLRKRLDHFHDLETVFYPVKIHDVLEVIESEKTTFHLSGELIEQAENSCLKAYYLLAENYKLPPVEIHLHKNIPVGAGLGGGSSDAAYMIKLLNEKFGLRLSQDEMFAYVRELGADCSFFLENQPVFAEGTGDKFSKLDLDLSSYHLLVIKPKISISTVDAYHAVIPSEKGKGLKQALKSPVEEWKNTVFNDFEVPLFKKYPEIREIKERLYAAGALFASMSGSGSSVFGIFKDKPTFPQDEKNYRIFIFNKKE